MARSRYRGPARSRDGDPGRRSAAGSMRSVLGALVSPRTWLAVIHLMAGLVIGMVAVHGAW